VPPPPEPAPVAMEGEYWYCESHRREATHIDPKGRHVCQPGLGGILLPCHAVIQKRGEPC